MITRGVVFESPRFWSPYGTAQPADAWPDQSRYGNDGAFLGAGQPDWQQLSSGLWVPQFDGTNDLIAITADPSIAFGNGYSMTYWVKIITYTQYRRIWGKWIHADNRMSVYMDTGNFIWLIRQGGVSHAFINATYTVGTWAHYAVTLNAAGNLAQHCKNGVVANTDAVYTVPDTTTADLQFGAVNGGSFGNIEMALATLYNYELTIDQINAIYASECYLFDGA